MMAIQRAARAYGASMNQGQRGHLLSKREIAVHSEGLTSEERETKKKFDLILKKALEHALK